MSQDNIPLFNAFKRLKATAGCYGNTTNSAKQGIPRTDQHILFICLFMFICEPKGKRSAPKLCRKPALKVENQIQQVFHWTAAETRNKLTQLLNQDNVVRSHEESVWGPGQTPRKRIDSAGSFLFWVFFQTNKTIHLFKVVLNKHWKLWYNFCLFFFFFFRYEKLTYLKHIP